MKGALITVAVLLVAVGLGAAVYWGYGISCYNEEVQLRNEHEANEKANQVVYTKFTRTVIEKCGVQNASVQAQKDLFAIVMNSKSGVSGALANFISQHNPNPDVALSETGAGFRSIMASIEGLREEFARVQKRSLAIEQTHKDLLGGYISGGMVRRFGGNMEPLVTQIIKSPEATRAFATGVDEGVDMGALFNQKPVEKPVAEKP